MAFTIQAKSEDNTPSTSLARVQFYIAKRDSDTGELSEQWLNTITCGALINKLASPEQIAIWKESATWEFFESESLISDDSDVLCPDITSLELDKDPYLYNEGSQLVGLVNRCDIATKID